MSKQSITNIVALIRKKSSNKHSDKRIVIIDTARPFMRGTPKVVTTWRPTPPNGTNFDEIIAKTVLNTPDGTAANPLDSALSEYTDAKGISLGRHAPMTIIPFDELSTMSGNIWHHGSVYNLYAKGAPEQVLLHCDLTENERELAEMAFHKLTTYGHSVVAIASAELAKPMRRFDELPKNIRLSLDGFVALSDTSSTKTKQAVSQALANGVTIIMLTGEHSETAYHAAHKLGIVSTRDEVFDSRRLHVMSDDEVLRQTKTVRVFARASPADKTRILSLLNSS